MRIHGKAIIAVLTALLMIIILFIPIHSAKREIPVHSASVKIRLTPLSPIRKSVIEEGELLSEQSSRTSDTEEHEESPDIPAPTPSPLAALRDTVEEQLPPIERPQRQSSPQRTAPVPDQSSLDSEEQEPESTAMHYHSLDEVTSAPGFDRALLASRIVYPDLARRQGKEGLVMLRLFISSHGQVERVIVEQDPGYGFAEAAVRAFQGLTGKPARRHGEAVAVTLLYPVRFTLS